MIKNIMLCFIFVMGLISFSYAEKTIVFIDKESSTPVGEMSLTEFKTLIEAGEMYNRILEAEENGNVKIHAVIEENKKEIFISNIILQYYDSSNKNFKTIYVNERIQVNENTELFYTIKKGYYDLASYSFPILILIIIILL